MTTIEQDAARGSAAVADPRGRRLRSLLPTVLGAAVLAVVVVRVIADADDPEVRVQLAERVEGGELGGAMLALGTVYYLFVHRHMKEANKPIAGPGGD